MGFKSMCDLRHDLFNETRKKVSNWDENNLYFLEKSFICFDIVVATFIKREELQIDDGFKFQ